MKGCNEESGVESSAVRNQERKCIIKGIPGFKKECLNKSRTVGTKSDQERIDLQVAICDVLGILYIADKY